MVGLDHGPAPEREFAPDETAARNARYGKVLFFIYLAFYAGFVLLNAFRPAIMDTVIAGVNLAIWYGFALIVVALVLALIYEVLCTREASTKAPPISKPAVPPDEEDRR